MEKEVKHLKHVFITIKGFPPWVVSQVISRIENEMSATQINLSIVNSETLRWKKGEDTIKNTKRLITKFYQNEK